MSETEEKTTMNSRPPILVTTALPYANGPLHLGHIYENILADFWVRYLKMRGREVYFYCADDTHGTAIMLEARKRQQTPEQFIQVIAQEHQRDFQGFLIEHSHYSSTHSDANRQLCYHIYQKMKDKGVIEKRWQSQLFCEHDQMFLPDRFVKGDCPKCGAPDQYGDSCEVCGATYTPNDLKKPRCAICSNTPVEKKVEQIFFKLNHLKNYLQNLLPKITDSGTQKKMSQWVSDDLRDWDISRNGPYFGFEIPGEENKFFYVWLDAPMGYISTCQEHQSTLGKSADLFWSKQSSAEVYHFIGKDIIQFHTLFWPALLEVADLRPPTFIFVHGFVQVNGQRMSKSRGNFILARQYLEHFPAEALRYYFASKSSGMNQSDLDLNLEDFVARVNGELVGKMVNLFSRSLKLLEQCGSRLGRLTPENKTLIKNLISEPKHQIDRAYQNQDYHLVIDQIRHFTDATNKYFDEQAPWKLIKEDKARAQEVLTVTLNLAKNMAVLLHPIVPELARRALSFFKEPPAISWDSLDREIEEMEMLPYSPLMTRLDPSQIKNLLVQA